MLGELLFESRGRITGQRVLSVENGIPKFEISIIGTGIFTGSLDQHPGRIGPFRDLMVLLIVKVKE
jgi:hypothetical protein